MNSMSRLLAVALLATLFGASEAMAQDPPPPDTATAPPTELVFQREIFTYPTFDRRNPFIRVSSNSAGGPRFELISLRTIIHSTNPDLSIAIFSTGGGAQQASADGEPVELEIEDMETRRLRRGQRWGNMRVQEIQRDRVIVVVEEFGITRTHEMLIPRAGQGGS